MFTPRDFDRILFLDTETAAIAPDYDHLPEALKPHWDHRTLLKGKEGSSPAEFFAEKAGIFAEFAKLVCISCGYVSFDAEGKPSIKLKSYFGTDERAILEAFTVDMNRFSDRGRGTLCAHNGKEFDFPFMGRRYLINGLPIPQALQIQGKKPWEIPHIDTMDLWKFGDIKTFSSLDLLCAVLNIPTPKDDLKGADVGRVFWQEGDVERIRVYCEKDVKATANVLLRMSRLPIME